MQVYDQVSMAPIYTPPHIANFFLSKKNHKIDNLKLNKIVYISLGFSLAISDRDMFQEDVQAWKYGPVIPSLYHEFKSYGSEVIKTKATEYSYEKKKRYTPIISSNENELLDILKIIWELYNESTSSKLVDLTHKKHTPWRLSFRKKEYGSIIPKSLIKDYYKAFLNIN